MRLSSIPVLLVVAWVPVALAAAPIENPDFTTDLSGWLDGESDSVTWLAEDLDECPGSGSMHLEHDFDLPILVTQCVAFTTTEAFTVEATIEAPTLAPAEFVALAYAGEACTGGSTVLSQEISDTSEPVRIQLHFEDPGSVQSVEVRLAALANVALSATPNATYDAIRIHPHDAVFLDGFEAGAVCRWNDSLSNAST